MTNDVNKFINDFKDSKISKIEIFEAFEYDVFTLEEQKYIFDNLKTKQKCQLYNTISVEARNKYCEYLDALEPVINDKGKKVVYFDEFMSSIRSQAVKDAKIMEQQLLDNGMCTRDWSIEQIKELYTFNESGALSTIPGTPKEYDEFGNPRYNVTVNKDGDVSVTQYSIEGHHMKNVSENNALAGDWRNIQFLERSGEHFDAHAKNFSNQTIAFYDGKNYVGVTYKAPRVENGVYIEGGYEANGKAYRFDDSEDVKKFVEITPSDSNYSQIMNEIQEYSGRRLPPEYKSTIFPSIEDAALMLNEDYLKELTSEQLFNTRIGIAEYRNLGIDIKSAHDSRIADYLRNVGEDSSLLSKTKIYLNEEGKIDEVIIKVDDASEEIKIVQSSSDGSSARYAVTASEYKTMNALPDNGMEISVGLRYHGSQFDDLTPIEKLKLRKSDAIFAEKSLYISLDNLDEETRKGLINQMIEIADNPELAKKAVFGFNENGDIIDFSLSGELSDNPNIKFSSAFSELSKAPSDYTIMKDYYGFGVSSKDTENAISKLEMQKLRAGIAKYKDIGSDELEKLVKLSCGTDEEIGKVLRQHLVSVAETSPDLNTFGYYFNGNGVLIGIGNDDINIPDGTHYKLSLEEVRNIPSDNAVNKITNKNKITDDMDLFLLKKSISEGNADEALRILEKNGVDTVSFKELIGKTDNKIDDAIRLIDSADGSVDDVLKAVSAAKNDVSETLKVLKNAGNNASDTAEILSKVDGDANTALKVIESADNDVKGAIKVLDETSDNVDDALRVLSKVDGNVDDAARILNKVSGNADDAVRVIDAAKGKADEAYKVLASVGNADDAVKVLNIYGGDISDAEIKSKYKLLTDDSYAIDFYKRAEYKIALGENPSKILVGELFDETKMQFSANHSIIAQDIKELRLDDFLEYAKNEYGLIATKDAAKAAHTTRAKLQLTKALRTGGNVLATAAQIYDMVKFIGEMADGLESGVYTPREVGKSSAEYIASTAGGWLAGEVAAAFFAAALPLVGVTGPLGVVAIIVFSIGAGIAGSKYGDWIMDKVYDPAYDTAWGITDLIGSDFAKNHFVEGTNDDNIMNFSEGIIKSGLLKYDVEYPVNASGLRGNDTIKGYKYDDMLDGGEDHDIIYGNGGNDTIYGGQGNDELHGGAGNDTIVGGSDIDTIYGDSGDDTLYGNDDNDIIYGGADNDTIYGGNGADRLYGESGTDTIYGGNGNDLIEGGDGGDTLYGDSVNGYMDGDDVISGGNGDDTIYGEGGEDILFGDSGNDTIYGDKKDKIYSCIGEEDIICGGDNDDKIWGGAEHDEIWGEDGNDKIWGGHGDDTIDGGLMNDTLHGGDGNDTLYGDSGDDTIYGDKGRDIINGGYGKDYLNGGDGDDTYIFDKEIYGNASNKGSVNDHDTVVDHYGYNTVLFKNTPTDLDKFNNVIRFKKSENSKDLIIYSIQTGATMEISGYYTDDSFRLKIDGSSKMYIINDDMKLEESTGSWTGGGSSMQGFADGMSGKFADDYKDASQALPPRDPLVIDLNSDGVHTTDVENGVYFDIDNNGFAERTAWIDNIDAFLVYNRDNDERITNGSELFSDQVMMSTGKKSAHGFEVLKSFDTDGNGIIDKRDAHFKDIKLWVDKDHNGITWLPEEGEEDNPDKKELYTLEEKGIVSISTKYVTDGTDSDDDVQEKLIHAEVKLENGSTTTVSEHWFDAVTSDTQELNTEAIDDDLTSFGNLHSVSYALEHDEDGYLKNLIETFRNSESYVEKRVLTRKILYRISGADEIEANSRGGSIDARELHVIETIMGVDQFVGAGNSTNPNSNAATILKNLFAKFEELYFNLLNQESNTSDALNLIVETLDENGKSILDMDILNEGIDGFDDTNGEDDNTICSIASYLKMYDNVNNTRYFEQFISSHPLAAETIRRYNNSNYIIGIDGADRIYGTSGNDIIWSDEGNDNIVASSGNDVVFGGNDDDTVDAGAGDDIVYGKSGNNVINAGTGNDIVYSEDGDDTINGDADNDTIYAGDGKNTVNGGEGDDRIYTGNGTDTVRGGDGNDIIESGDGDDIIYGEADDDIIDAGEGNDKIYGGAGNDDMNGGDGDDTFYIGIEHGNDIIRDSEGHTTIVFEDELSESDYKHSVDISGGFVLVNKETEERISLADFINSPLDYTFKFNDEETILGGGDRINSVDGTEDDDTITLENGFNIVHGNGGADTITGGSGIDFIYGGDGNDVLNGGEGTNIVFGEGDDDIITDGSGDSYLNGGAGNDTIYGYDGNDVLIGGADVDELYGGEGNDALAGNDGGDYMYGENGSDVLYGDEGNDYLYGGEGNDYLFGGDDNDELYGDEGDDYLESGNGLDYLYGGTGDDTFVGGEGTKYMYGEDGNDTFYGGNGINYMYGGEGNDVFTGGENYDYIEGGSGDDVMNGGNGENEMYGNDGNDIICGGNVADYIEGGAGNDTIYGGNGENTIYGNEGNDIIYGGDNGSYLNGGEGNDEIYAGGGADILDGGSGDDYLQGDHGNDTYIFARGYDTDTISASSALHTIVIHDYSVSDMINSRESNNDLVIDFGENTGDRIIIRGFFNFNSNREFKFVFDDGTELGQSDIKAKSAPVVGDEGNNYLNGTDDNDIIDGGAGIDSLNGFGGEDTYIFGKGYAQDMINEWGSDHSFVNLKDIRSDEVTVSDQWGSNLLVSVNDTDDVLTISNFKWGQATYTFRFADGAEGYVDKNTWELVLTKQPDVIEEEPTDETEELVQESAEILESLYTEEVSEDLAVSEISELLTSDTVSVSEETEEVFDQTDIQVMILTENMAAFGSEENVFDNTSFAENSDVSIIDQMLVNTSAQ